MNGHFWHKHLFGSYRGRISRRCGTTIRNRSVRFEIKHRKPYSGSDFGKEIKDNTVSNILHMTWYTDQFAPFEYELSLEECALHNEIKEEKTLVTNNHLISAPSIKNIITNEYNYDLIGEGCCIHPIEGIEWGDAVHYLKFRNENLTTIRIEKKAGTLPVNFFRYYPDNAVIYGLEVTDIVKCQTK